MPVFCPNVLGKYKPSPARVSPAHVLAHVLAQIVVPQIVVLQIVVLQRVVPQIVVLFWNPNPQKTAKLVPCDSQRNSEPNRLKGVLWRIILTPFAKERDRFFFNF